MLQPDASCFYKGHSTNPCAYTIATGGASTPSSNQTWVLQMTGKHVTVTLEIIALNHDQFAVRDGDELTTFKRVADVDTRVCTGDAVPCENLDPVSCGESAGCMNTSDCIGEPGSGCDTYGSYECVEHPECDVVDVCTGYPNECEPLATTECETRPGCSLK